MQKTEYFYCFCYSILLFFSKDVRLNSTHYLIIKINNRIELKNTATDHSSDKNYQDFKKIYRECTKEPYNVFANTYYLTSK